MQSTQIVSSAIHANTIIFSIFLLGTDLQTYVTTNIFNVALRKHIKTQRKHIESRLLTHTCTIILVGNTMGDKHIINISFRKHKCKQKHILNVSSTYLWGNTLKDKCTPNSGSSHCSKMPSSRWSQHSNFILPVMCFMFTLGAPNSDKCKKADPKIPQNLLL